MNSPFAAMRGTAPVLVAQPTVTLPDNTAEPKLLRVEIFYRALPKGSGFRILESAQRKEHTFTLKAGWTKNEGVKALEEKFITARVNEMKREFMKQHPEETVLFRGGQVERDTVQIVVRTSYPVQEEQNAASDN